MNPDVWGAISAEAKDLTLRLLDIDPNRRLNIEEALRHPWIAQKSRAPKTHLHETVESMKCFNARRRLKVSGGNLLKFNGHQNSETIQSILALSLSLDMPTTSTY